jgi:hypothetical protein
MVYIRLAKKEEQLVRKEFDPAYSHYARVVPAFIPSFIRRGNVPPKQPVDQSAKGGETHG